MSSDQEKIAKKRKLDEETEQKGLKSFDGFTVTKVLNENASSKSIFLMGKFSKDETVNKDKDAVVILEKTPFSEETVGSLLSSKMELSLQMQNDIYGMFDGYPDKELNGVKTTVIYPATERHILKYTAQNINLISETYDDYVNITLPYLKSRQFSVQWVYNILDKSAEAERIVFEDEDKEKGFVLLPDMKWDQKQVENLYLIAICHRRDLMSLRDLNDDHLPLLKNIQQKCIKAVEEKFSVPPRQLRLYVHYQPSYYHFHVHITHLKFDAPGTQVAKAYLLSDVIENIEMVGNYYQKKTITFTQRENDGLLLKFREAGKL
ncbi:m7GpppX diphosphatase-like [Anneissia japonica]|uniref:m7GpppX diphosphatase-like n=1 Tax=Anneissia japonica TaxID=1529436 RepID=UPI0014259822|nr:m7GpppX diphosphatase-like [Anneissia japonica]